MAPPSSSDKIQKIMDDFANLRKSEYIPIYMWNEAVISFTSCIQMLGQVARPKFIQMLLDSLLDVRPKSVKFVNHWGSLIRIVGNDEFAGIEATSETFCFNVLEEGRKINVTLTDVSKVLIIIAQDF